MANIAATSGALFPKAKAADMGRLLDALSVDSGKPFGCYSAIPAIPSPIATTENSGVAGIAAAQVLMRERLLALAADEFLAASLVHRLTEADLIACEDCVDNELRAYLMALERSACMAAFEVPASYTIAAQCTGCGPVWLWQNAPAHVIACPWCWHRRAGRTIPRSPVACGDCRHYQPDPINPEAGMGSCELGPGRAYWPMKLHRCDDYISQKTGG